ncbi:MAG: ABC transporter permease, partial [Pseudomonadota bacterium]
LAWILAALGVYVRDITQLGGLVATAMLFLSPVFYPLSSVPPAYAGIVALNPLTFVVESTRGLLFDGRLPDLMLAGGHSLAAGVVAVAGLLLFRRLRPGFGDVL